MSIALVKVSSAVYVRSAYIDRYGHRHPSTKIKRKGYTRKVKRAKGRARRTPRSQRWYGPKVHMGWKKSQTAKMRRQLALKSHKNALSAARALQALANVTTDTR